jgi:16S rRNA (uracil1498-N3)-methyltransferase
LVAPRHPDTPFWVESESVGSDRLTLSPEESHHLLHVHRARAGTPFEATDGEGHFFDCVLESVERRSAVARILKRRSDVGELRISLAILVGMPDWRAMEQIVAHGVPLGVTVFDFVACDRSAGDALSPQKLERLGRIARAALKQSRRSFLPAIGSSPSLASSVRMLEKSMRYFADPGSEDRVAATASLPKTTEEAISLAVGPPGGFTEEERRVLLGGHFAPISLGPSRLTTETATLALISLARNTL